MESSTLFDLCRASDYANSILLHEVGKLSLAQLEEERSPSHHSIWKLLRHILAVETHYSLAAQGRLNEFEQPAIDTIADLEEYWEAIALQRLEYVAALTDEDADEIINFRLGDHRFALPARQLIIQALIHSAHHRGELSVVMTELDHPLPTLDSIALFVEDCGSVWPYK